MTDKQIAEALEDMVIITDTREQKNEHILSYFDAMGIKHVTKKLDTGDYSFELPNHPELGLDRKFIIEKKNSLDEIAGNFTKDRERFVREFERVTDTEQIHLLIENATWKKLLHGSYRSKFPPQSFMASILTFHIRYNCPVWFATADESPVLIHQILKYELREALKNI